MSMNPQDTFAALMARPLKFATAPRLEPIVRRKPILSKAPVNEPWEHFKPASKKAEAETTIDATHLYVRMRYFSRW